MSRFAQVIVAATDLSVASELAISASAVLAEQNQAALHLVHAHVPTDPTTLREDPTSHRIVPTPNVKAELEEQLRRLAERLAPGRDVRVAVVAGEAPAEAIVAHAHELDADLLVVATHGRTGLRHLVLGSVAEEVVRTASCPVLTLRSKAPR
jgi:nucleotide-binding universal stress UspA family protein